LPCYLSEPAFSVSDLNLRLSTFLHARSMLVKHTKHLSIAGSELHPKRTILALFLVCP